MWDYTVFTSFPYWHCGRQNYWSTIVSTDSVGAMCGKSGLTPTPSDPYLQGKPVLTFLANYQFGNLLLFPFHFYVTFSPLLPVSC